MFKGKYTINNWIDNGLFYLLFYLVEPELIPIFDLSVGNRDRRQMKMVKKSEVR
jgi:hypothetical protein